MMLKMMKQVPNTKSEQHEPRVKQIGNIDEGGDFKNRQTGRVYDTSGIAPTLRSHGGGGHEPKICDGDRLRKLTPLEYWRLQGIPDELFYRAKSAGLSDSRLYKLAGNGVTVPVIYEMARRMEIP